MADEQEIRFKVMSDLTVLGVQDEKTKDTLFEISGYGMQVKLNRDKINSLEDVEDLLQGITSMYRKMILKEMLPGREKNNS